MPDIIGQPIIDLKCESLDSCLTKPALSTLVLLPKRKGFKYLKLLSECVIGSVLYQWHIYNLSCITAPSNLISITA